ncbi:DUF167 domain-containing protein [Alcanivorax sp. JB21]|uniref:DUF167 domain-containing protein n=1 Tax=Alcanivorax limicola TaxID=2874102 RepID=UPI001CBE3B13|nr:DUF167 domain-containing protein [Alcanivorax limicola]MBZ2189408.1 DUF167 domain-containing protein [Alcanivorax limicola]
MTKLNIKVVPGASRTEIAGWMGDALRVRVAAPPEKGKANREAERLLSSVLELPQGSVRVTSGAASQWKVVEVQGLSGDQIIDRLSDVSRKKGE